MWSNVFVAHLLRLNKDLKIDVYAAEFFVFLVGEIIKRCRIAGLAFERFCAERSESLHRDDKRRDSRREILGQKRPERLVFPRLNVAGGPVVYEAQPEDMFLRFADRDRRAQLVSLPDKKPDLHLVIETLARDKHGRSLRVAPVLPVRPLDVRPRDHYRRSPPVIPDRHIFVIRQQRIVRPKHRSDVCCVIDRAIEIRVVTDYEGRLEYAFFYGIQPFFEFLAKLIFGIKRKSVRHYFSYRRPDLTGAYRKEFNAAVDIRIDIIICT